MKKNDALTLFSKNDTSLLKGVAILAMVFHHTVQVNPGLPIGAYDFYSAETLFAAAGKVCVALLTLLSGFGLAEGYRKQKKHTVSHALRFTLSHLLQLLSVYWSFLVIRHAYAWFTEGVTPADFYGFGFSGVFHALADLTGIGFFIGTPTGGTDWYLRAVLIFYILFPLLFFLLEKGKKPGKALLLAAAYTPWIIYLIRNDIDLETDNALFYLFSFMLGIVLSQSGLLAAQKGMGRSWKGIFFSLAFFASAFGLRAYVALPADPLLAFALVELEIFVLSLIPGLRGLLSALGKQSANIWLLHPLVLLSLGQGFVEKWMLWITAVFISAGLSMATEALREQSGFNRLLRTVRARLTSTGGHPSAPSEK